MGPLFEPLAPPGYVVREANPASLGAAPLAYPEEEAAITRAVASRKQQYRAARKLFRAALEALDEPPAALLNSEDRAPIWPPGLVGSLTHTDGWVGVILGRACGMNAIGIDVESNDPLTPALLERVATPAEVEALSAHGEAEALQLGKLLFSAKESFYKCQYPHSRTFLGFQDVELTFDHARRTFSSRLLVEVPILGRNADAFVGRYCVAGAFVATLVSGAVEALPVEL